MEPHQNHLEATPSDTEPGMNLISADFDLVMVNRRNERLYGKPIVALLGKKCYREFEKRDEPCPHCPGKLALATGESHETDTVGLRDDGTRFFARIRAVPVSGPQGQPTGFIEVVEDITEQKRAESLAAIYAALRTALLRTHSLRKALREAFEAAMQVECIDVGCIFSIDPATGSQDMVYSRNVPPTCLPLLAELSRGGSKTLLAESDGAPRDVEVLSILHAGRAVATLVLGTSTYPEIPATLRAGLQSLGAAAGHSVSRIRAEQSRGDAVADLEALIAINPVATFVLDAESRVTLWNRAAERLFGWKAAEVTGRPCPFDLPGPGQDTSSPGSTGPHMTAVLTKSGSPVDVRLATAPFRDLVGDASTTIVVVEDLTAQRRLADLENRLALADTLRSEGSAHVSQDGGLAGNDLRAVKVLIIDSSGSWGQELADVLVQLHCEPTLCKAVSDAASTLTHAESGCRAFDLAVVDLIAPTRSGGLEQAAALRGLGLKAPVLASSDADARGHEQHGIAAVIKRPVDPTEVARVILGVLEPRR